MEQLNLRQIWRELGPDRDQIGLWREQFIVPLQRLQTNYSREHYKPGLANLPDVTHPAHDYTEYWGAGRDRLEASANDLFEIPTPLRPPPVRPSGFGQHLFGSNYDNMCHIRSGQQWEESDTEECEAYENNLQRVLMTGMIYLWENPEETGSIGLRMARRITGGNRLVKETSVMGFHRNWSDLEKWSSRHPSHLAIFSGSVQHGRRFGENRKFMTWQEVAILKAGEATFEYLNCDPRTGVIIWVDLASQSLATFKKSVL